ncbi:MAG: bifunctional hydroxymethylpyrimidine kinase/phosphomethylpyrimidine kinase [Myxococcaceae bacterium]|nr:bifunctional hydroxymethylpyrimidine kinase/phosphomethylpyrimidine kinase [Myxococcaceae bacterium]
MPQNAPVKGPLPNVVKRFSRVRAVVLGDLVADHYVYGLTERVSREAPVLIVRHEREEVKPGGAANVAANVAALGGRVSAVGGLGKDAMGAALAASLQRAGVTPAWVQVPETETKLRVLAGAVGTRRQQMLRVDRGATQGLPDKARRALARAVKAELDAAQVAVVSDYGAGVVCDETREVLRAWAKRGGLVCADSRSALLELKGSTVCKPNEPELAALTGMALETDDDVLFAAQRARALLECQVLVVTRGRRGMVIADGTHTTVLPVHGSAEAVDVTGAGDTVAASFALAFGAGASALEAAFLANVAGALVVQKPGTATVSGPELSAALDALP